MIRIGNKHSPTAISVFGDLPQRQSAYWQQNNTISHQSQRPDLHSQTVS